MNVDRLGRFELLITWGKKLNDFKSTGECTQQLEHFLRTVESLPGEEVGEICNEWRRRQRGQRPWLALTYLALAVFVILLGGPLLGSLIAYLTVIAVSSYALQSLYFHWKREENFDSELYSRALYVVSIPTWAR